VAWGNASIGTTMNLSQIADELVRTIEECRGLGIPQDSLDDSRENAEAGEPGIAVENLCSNLHEYDVVVPAKIYDSLAKLGSHMGIDAKYWTIMSRSLSELLGQIRWADASIEDIHIDYEAVTLRVAQEDGKVSTLRAEGYIGCSLVGFWDEMIIERAEVVEKHAGLAACVDLVRRRQGASWSDTGSEARNSRHFFALLVHLIDGSVLEIFAARLRWAELGR
jgi:hypothetical protein